MNIRDKNISEYLDIISDLAVQKHSISDFIVTGVTNDSRKVRDGHIFVAIKGFETDGHRFIPQAINSGAQVVIYQDELESYCPHRAYVRVTDSYFAYSLLCECYFDFPAEQLKLIGVTGTNGKTSSAFLIKHLLESAGYSCGLISTIRYEIGTKCINAKRTTPEAFELQQLFYEMVQAKCEYAIMEVSSHALQQYRPGNALFTGTLFTNLTGDHLDYHGDMESYFHSKARLFTKYTKQNAIMVVNGDDKYGIKLVEMLDNQKCYLYGKSISCSDCLIRQIQFSSNGMEMTLDLSGKVLNTHSCLIGEYNVYNIAGAVLMVFRLGLSLHQIDIGLREPIRIPGRLEGYHSAKGGHIFIDYAHTDDALKNVLKTLRDLATNRLVVVFGCGGDRDTSKRPRMGAVAAEYADVIILTSDNPRTENPMEIITQIRDGIPDGKKVFEIENRSEAIKASIENATCEDIVLIAGKGHETTQEIKGRYYDFRDSDEILKAINQTGSG